MDGSGVVNLLRSVTGSNPGMQLTPLPRLKLQAPDAQLSLEVKRTKPKDLEDKPKVTFEKPKLLSTDEVFKRIPMEDLSKFLNQLNMSTNLFAFDRDIKFDDQINWFRVVIRNTETGKVVREIPPWDLSKIIAYIQNEVGKRLDLVV